MSRRMWLVGCCLVLSVTALHSQTKVRPAPFRSAPFRTSWGDPDLQGMWNFAAGTPLERPAEFAGKALLSDDEFAQAESRARDRSNQDRRDGAGTDVDVDREANEFWFQRRPTFLTRRTSLIIDPPDGRLPPLTSEAEQKRDARAAALRTRPSADSWEDRALNERCLKNPGNGPPILPLSIDVLIGHMVIAVGINCAAWTAFLVLTPPLSESEFAAIASRRAQWDPGDLVSDQATVVAGRAFNRFSLAEKPLMLTAGPAVLASTLYVVPVRYPGSLPTRNESYVIALTSLVLSSAFWITIAGVIASVRARRRRAGAMRE